MAASSKNQLLAKKGAELIMLQREQQTIQAVMSMVKDQINRLKIEEFELKNCITKRDIRNVTQAHAGPHQEGTTTQVIPVGPNPYELFQMEKAKLQSSQGSSGTIVHTQEAIEVNLTDLNLGVADELLEDVDDDSSLDDEDECVL